ncbi:MAG: NAD(+)/NADH kinase [Rhizobiaceae bacterium]|nr:NAD(+)/NADH kinase [Rhizobiaceae bacterium]
MADRQRIGLIVNPIAGIGGRLAARGSDLFANLEDAQESGGIPIAEERAKRALRRLFSLSPDLDILVASEAMGASAARSAGFAPLLLEGSYAEISTAGDTKSAATEMIRSGIGLILFAGGDGTARDIFDAVGDRVVLIGIPTGVKMHSAVFAVSPEAAGETAARAIMRNSGERLAEIMDADEAELAAGRPSTHLFGYAKTPAIPTYFQSAKAARPDGGEAAIEALGRTLARQARPGQLVILGAGTTMALVKPAFGLEETLLGVDVVCDGQTIAMDADADTLEGLCERHADILLITSIIGGQGFLFGRGNQQISPKLLRTIGPAGLRIVCTREKLLALPRAELLIDTGDPELDEALAGYRRVDTGPNDSMLVRLRACP